MQGMLAIQGNGGGAGAVQSGHELLPDAFGLAHADDHDFAFEAERFLQHFDGLGEAFVETVGQESQLGGFDSKDRAGFLD